MTHKLEAKVPPETGTVRSYSRSSSLFLRSVHGAPCRSVTLEHSEAISPKRSICSPSWNSRISFLWRVPLSSSRTDGFRTSHSLVSESCCWQISLFWGLFFWGLGPGPESLHPLPAAQTQSVADGGMRKCSVETHRWSPSANRVFLKLRFKWPWPFHDVWCWRDYWHRIRLR
jgi:hypothetical protein